MTPLISIVIPVKNGAPWLDNLFERLSSQTLYNDCEIVVIDSGSTDGSVEICRQHGVTLHRIEPSDFNHGLTRNLGVRLSRGRYILMTVQDALPQNELFLEQMVDCLMTEDASAVCGMQVVPEIPETNPFNWHRPVSEPEVYSYQFRETSVFDRLPPGRKRAICSWDNVCAMYRSDVIRKIPFRNIDFGEDMAWCMDALQAGLKICYNPKAKVFHYHLDDGNYVYRRTFTEFYSYYSLFGALPEKGSIIQFIRRIISLLVKENQIPPGRKLFWIKKEIRYNRIVERVTDDFLKYLNKGKEELKIFYQITCGQPVQAPKP